MRREKNWKKALLAVLVMVLVPLVYQDTRADTAARTLTLTVSSSSSTPDLTPPICGLNGTGANIVPNATAWTNFTPPALGGTYVDSTYGCPATRITDGVAANLAQYHYYATREPMSAGDTKVLIFDSNGNWHIVNLTGGVVVPVSGMPADNDGSGLIWDRVNDAVFYLASGYTLNKCTVSGIAPGATVSCVTNHTFSEYSGYQIEIMDETDISPDNNWIPMVGQNVSGGTIDVFLWNVNALTKSPVYTTTCTGTVDGEQPGCLHKLIVTPNDGIIVGFESNGTSAEEGNRLWESPWTKPLPYVQNLTGHLDTAKDLASTPNEIYATEDPLDNPGPFGTCPDGWNPTLLVVGGTTPDNGYGANGSCMFDDSTGNPGWHISSRDWPRRGWYVFSSQANANNNALRFNNDPAYAAPTSSGWGDFDAEIVLVRLDINNNVNLMYRLALDHARGIPNYFWSDPRAAISYDGNYVIFDSNAAWSATGCGAVTECSDVYIIKIH